MDRRLRDDDGGGVVLHGALPAGAVTVYNYNMAGVTGPVQFGNGNVMYVGGAVTSSPQVRHHRPSSTSSEGRRHTRQKKQINGITPPSSTWFLGSTRVHSPNGIWIGSAVFTGLTVITDRETDRPRYSVCNNRPRLRSTSCDVPDSVSVCPQRVKCCSAASHV